jgi:integrase
VQSEQTDKRSITVRQALESRLESNKRLRASTKAIYRYEVEKYLSDWLDTPLQEISRDQVLAKHIEISGRTKSKADSAMKALGTLYPYARKVLQIPVESPVTILYDARAWNGSKPRAAPLAESRLLQLATALRELESASDASTKQRTFVALIYFILLTGLRRNEAAMLTWDRVDFAEGKLTIDATKNGLVHVLPLSRQLMVWLKLRKLATSGPHVFPGTKASRFGYITGIAELLSKLRKEAGDGFDKFSPHDLRATFATVAERCQVNTYTLKKLLNHKPSDVTGIVYVQPSQEDLRDAMERIGSRLANLMCPQLQNRGAA